MKNPFLIDGKYTLEELFDTKSLIMMIKNFSLAVGIFFDFFSFIEDKSVVSGVPEMMHLGPVSVINQKSDDLNPALIPTGKGSSVLGFSPVKIRGVYIGNIYSEPLILEGQEDTLPPKIVQSLIFIRKAMNHQIEHELMKREVKLYKEEALDREIFLNRIIDQSPFAIWISDPQGTMIRCNTALKRMLNLKEEDLIGKYNVLSDPVILEKGLLENVKAVYLEGKHFEAELSWEGFLNNKLDLKEGNPVKVIATIFPIFDSQGKTTHGVCQLMDISSRKKAENEVQHYREELEQMLESRTRELQYTQTIFDAFLENNPIYVFFKDKDIRTIKLSKNYEQLLGLPMDQILGKSMDELFPSDLAKAMIEDDKRILHEETLYQVEEELEGRYFETMKFPIYIDDSPQILAGFTMDITDRKKAEQKLVSLNLKLAELNGKLQSLLENTSIIIWSLKSDFTLDFLNDRFKALLLDSFGLDVHEGDNFLDLLPLEFRDFWVELIDVPLSGKTLRKEFWQEMGSAQPMYLRLNGNPVTVDGTLTGASFFATNITEIKRAEQQLNQSQRMDSLGLLAGGVAHNFNNMLTGIMGSAELLKNLPDNDPRKVELIDMILLSSERAAELSVKLLQFSRPQDSHFQEMDLHEMLGQLKSILSKTIDKQVNLGFSLNAKKTGVSGDHVMLQSVFLNLAINAVQAMKNKGKLKFKTFNVIVSAEEENETLPAGEYIAVNVIDNGPGISSDLVLKIFDPFFTTKEHGKGTGLGLSTALGTIKQHEGSIEVISSEGEGCSFMVMLPVVPS